MRPIPPKLREELAGDPYMKRCALSYRGNCSGRIEWHHVWIYGGKQINEAWAIEPACHYHHEQVNKDREIKQNFERFSLDRVTTKELEKYPRKNWRQLHSFLNQHDA